MINDPNCKDCNGNGWIIGVIGVAECCGNFDDNFNCCNVPIEVPEQIQMRCPNCEAYEDACKDSIIPNPL